MQPEFYYLAFCIANHFILLSQLESKLMTIIDKKILITFESVTISKLGQVKKLKFFEIQLLRLIYLYKV